MTNKDVIWNTTLPQRSTLNFCPSAGQTWKHAAGTSWTLWWWAVTPMWTTPASALPSSAACWKPRVLSQFSTIDEVKAALSSVRVVGLEKTAVVHWRIGEPSGRQVVLEIVGGVPHFYENEVGVLTNAPGFEWQLTNLNNYVNLHPGDASVQKLSGITLQPTGSNSGFLGIPGDATPPSRFVRAAFYRGTAPQRATGFDTVQQCFHLLNNFDIPIGIEHSQGDIPDIPSATQWTSAIDLTNRKVYYKTAYNNSIRCIDLKAIDFSKVKYQSQPLDKIQEQPVEMVKIPR